MRHLQKSGIITLKALGVPIGSRTAQVQEQQLEETKFIAFFMGKKIDIEGNKIDILKTLPEDVLAKIAIISIEILPSINNLDFISRLNDFIPRTYEFYRERRYGLVSIQRNNPHWTDNLNLFQNLILINSQVIKKNHQFIQLIHCIGDSHSRN